MKVFRRLVVKVEVWLFFWGGVLHVHTIYAIHTIYTIYAIYTTPSTLSTLSTPSVSRECPSSPCVTISPSVSSPYAVVTCHEAPSRSHGAVFNIHCDLQWCRAVTRSQHTQYRRLTYNSSREILLHTICVVRTM